MKRSALAGCAFALAACSTAPPPPEPKVSQPAAARILQFYASPVTIAKGDRTLLCYGVEGAASVRLDPAVEEIAPSRTRCIEAKPAASTKYTLYARNQNGDEVSQHIEVVIDPKLPRAAADTGAGAGAGGGLILFFSAGVQGKVAKGAQVPLCYGVKGASAVSLSPPVMALTPSERICFQVSPQKSANYVLTAVSASGEKDTETVRLIVE